MKDSFRPPACPVATIADNAMIDVQTVEFPEAVTLVGGGAAAGAELRRALGLAPRLVAADGGANVAVAAGLVPDLVIGDFDSVTAEALAQVPPARQMRLPEQETTDFEKCLSRIAAPFVLGVGFLGPRFDHTLAVFSALVRHPGKLCLLVGGEDIVFAAPPRLVLDLPPGTRLSLFPMRTVRGESRGLRWPIGGLEFAPDGVIGTSNEVTGPLDLRMEAPGMLAILPAGMLGQALTALRSGQRWPSPGGR